MISAFDKTFKLGILLSVIDWLTFNVVFLLFTLFSGADTSGEFVADLLMANVSYVVALQIVTIYGAQNEAYMSRSAEKWVRGLCFNELGVCG